MNQPPRSAKDVVAALTEAFPRCRPRCKRPEMAATFADNVERGFMKQDVEGLGVLERHAENRYLSGDGLEAGPMGEPKPT